MSNIVVLDTFALLAYFNDEPSAEEIEHLLFQSEISNKYCLFHRINWGEIYYVAYKRGGIKAAEEVVKRIDKLPIKVVDDFSLEYIKSVATLKGKYSVSYADSFAIHLALKHAVPLVTGDSEIKNVERKEKGLSLKWVGF